MDTFVVEADRDGIARHGTHQDNDFFDVSRVIETCDELPDAVRTATFSRIDGRFLDKRLFRILISQTPVKGAEDGWSTRIWEREKALMPHIGRFLMCVLIRLPGVHYTIEIDPEQRCIVHWEWQTV